MFEKIFMSFTAGPKKVGTPEKKNPGKVNRIVGILYGKLNLSFLEFVHGVFDNFFVGCSALIHSFFA
jgi:hypothetical protein